MEMAPHRRAARAIELLADTTSRKRAATRRPHRDPGPWLPVDPEAIGIDPGSRWLDACAGAGGKTLQLAALTGPRGHVDAHDIRADALRELRARAARAGLKNIAVLNSPTGRPTMACSSMRPAAAPAPGAARRT